MDPHLITFGTTRDHLCDTKIKERIQARDAAKVLDSLREEYKNASLLPWQEEVRAIVTGPIDPRKVHWYWEKNGNVGKT